MTSLLMTCILATGGIWSDALTPEPAQPTISWTDALLQEHSGQPTTRPSRLNHTYLHWGQCGCLMCLGQHLRNTHGQTFQSVEKVGYNGWKNWHLRLHREGVKPKVITGCEDGFCPARIGQKLFPILRGRFRR